MTINDIKKRVYELSNKQGLLTEQEESDLYEIQGIIDGHREKAFNDYLDALKLGESNKIKDSERRNDAMRYILIDIDKILNRQYKLKYPELFHD